MKRTTGTYQTLGNLSSFVPNPLPPANPDLNVSGLTELYGSAMLKLGQLNEIANRLPNVQRFVKAYVIKEALLSSAIEGIHTTLLDVFTQPLSGTKPNKETQLVLNYTEALDIALHIMQEQGIPLASRVILSAHKALMRVGQVDQASPGQYRKQAVRVGSLVPPPANQIPKLMADLENYMNTENNALPPLIRAGLVHVQFETIHPFLDGNGRIGRLLIVLMLIDQGLLSAPILYPSYYFKKHHLYYYQHLDEVRTQGDFEGWIKFYLQAIEASCTDAYQRVKDIEILEQNIKNLLQSATLSTRTHCAAVEVLSLLFQFPIISVTELAQQLNKNYNTAQSFIKLFIKHGILFEITGHKRNKLYRFDAYLNLLEREYD